VSGNQSSILMVLSLHPFEAYAITDSVDDRQLQGRALAAVRTTPSKCQ
jgi:hypothetical protein